jgi:hypothetical protein
MTLWLNRAVILSKAEGSQVDIRSLSSSRVEEIMEEGDLSFLMDPASLPLLLCVPPNFAPPVFALPCVHNSALFCYPPLALPALDRLSSLSLHSSHIYNIGVCSFSKNISMYLFRKDRPLSR